MNTTLHIIAGITLALMVWSVKLLHGHKRHTSEIIKRLEEHHDYTRQNASILKDQVKRTDELTLEIMDFLKSPAPTNPEEPPEVGDFFKTDKFTHDR